MNGADFVLGLEPETDGATKGCLSTLRRLIDQLGLEGRVESTACLLQDLPTMSPPFDVAILYDVINHFDEDAVQRLHHDVGSQERYVHLLGHLRRVLAPGATVIVADSDCSNFWPHVGMRAPLAPSIEWHKHQSPELWKEVFGKAGFHALDLRWSPLYPLGSLSTNKLAQRFISSHFILRFKLKPEAS